MAAGHGSWSVFRMLSYHMVFGRFQPILTIRGTGFELLTEVILNKESLENKERPVLEPDLALFVLGLAPPAHLNQQPIF